MKRIISTVLCLMLCISLIKVNFTEVKAMEKGREILNFNSGWLYLDSDYTNAQLKDFDDSEFKKVCVPHANRVLTEHKGGEVNFREQIASYRFVSWYRRHFTLPESYTGKRIFVEFEAVANACDVFVNGQKAGDHKGAYTGFKFEITDYVIFGEDNVIAVRCDSTKRDDIPPEGGSVDYCLFGGIVRNVNMIVTNDNYIEDVFVTTTELTKEKAVLKVDVTLNRDEKYTVELIDSDGDCVAQGESILEVQNPHLWNIDDPYLYTVCVSLESGDIFETRIGIREVKFTNSGVMVNGEEVKVLGINRHEQWPWQGRAIPDKLQAKDADMIKETGFNAVRCSHYPQSPAFLNRCDELGLLVFEEAPGWQHIGDDAWQQVYMENIREMILRDRNHPSIISWGVRVNESNDNDALYEKTNALARSLDSTRPTHGARRQDTYQTSTFLEDIYTAHYIYPENPVHTPFLITEHSWDCWTNGYGYPWASDEQSLAFTKDFADKVNYYYGNENCAGGFAWSMFDYNNEVNYTRTNNVFYSGLYDIFRTPKMAANLYISQKDPEKCGANIYIANYWDDDSKPLTVKEVSGDIAQGDASGGGVSVGDTFCVTVMSNCEKVELYVNGEKFDKEPVRQYNNLPHPFFVFEDVPYKDGEVTAVGYIGGVEAIRYTQKTPEKAEKIVLEPDYNTLVADGTDMTQVIVTLRDKNGTRLNQADNQVEISVSGAGEFIGEETIKLEGGRTAFIVKTKYKEAGDIVCTVKSNGVETGVCTIKVEEYAEENSVPFSVGEGTIAPKPVKEYNDTQSVFEYSSDWLYTKQNGCYNGDNHYSNTTDGTARVNFVGRQIAWYGSVNSNHGIMGITLDDKEEVFIDCYGETRKDNQLLYISEPLPYGNHTLTVRVTGEKNASATGYYVNADFVKITDEPLLLTGKCTDISFENFKKSSGEWVLAEDKCSQNKTSGDSLMLYENEFENGSLKCRVSVPEKNGAGVGVVAGAKDENNFYLFEIKVVDNNLTWAIWLNKNNSWTQLVGGPCHVTEKEVYLKFETYNNTLCALISDNGEDYIALGACVDYNYSSGFVGVRTHSTSASFENFCLSYKVNARYKVTDVKINNGVLDKVTLDIYDEIKDGDQIIIARYDGDTLIKADTVQISDSEILLDEVLSGNKVKIFVWNGLNAVSEVYEVIL